MILYPAVTILSVVAILWFTGYFETWRAIDEEQRVFEEALAEEKEKAGKTDASAFGIEPTPTPSPAEPPPATPTATPDPRIVVVASAVSAADALLREGDLLNGFAPVAQDPDSYQFLGLLTSDGGVRASVCSPTGPYGVTGIAGVFHATGTYGAPISASSAADPNASHPPRIIRSGRVLAYLTANDAPSDDLEAGIPRVKLDVLLEAIGCRPPIDLSGPLPIADADGVIALKTASDVALRLFEKQIRREDPLGHFGFLGDADRVVSQGDTFSSAQAGITVGWIERDRDDRNSICNARGPYGSSDISVVEPLGRGVPIESFAGNLFDPLYVHGATTGDRSPWDSKAKLPPVIHRGPTAIAYLTMNFSAADDFVATVPRVSPYALLEMLGCSR